MFNYHETLSSSQCAIIFYVCIHRCELIFLIHTQLKSPTKNRFSRFRLLHKQTTFSSWNWKIASNFTSNVGCGKSLIEFACSLITDVRNFNEEAKISTCIVAHLLCAGIERFPHGFNGILIALSQTCKSLINSTAVDTFYYKTFIGRNKFNWISDFRGIISRNKINKKALNLTLNGLPSFKPFIKQLTHKNNTKVFPKWFCHHKLYHSRCRWAILSHFCFLLTRNFVFYLIRKIYSVNKYFRCEISSYFNELASSVLSSGT